MPYQIQIQGLDKLKGRLRGAGVIVNRHLKDAMHKSVFAVQSDVRRETPVDTGRLRQSVGAKVTGIGAGLTGIVGTNVLYAQMVEEGTKAHEIRPKTARVLRFMVGTTVVFAKRVRHPGSKGRWMFKKAFEGNTGNIKGFFTRAIEKVAEDLAR